MVEEMLLTDPTKMASFDRSLLDTAPALHKGISAILYKLNETMVGKLILHGDPYKEVSIMRRVSGCPNVIKLLGECNVDGRTLIVQSYGGRDLFSIVNDIVDVQPIMFQVASAVEYLHDLHVVHRDIKLENIVFDGRVARLIDFGLSCELFCGNRYCNNVVGTIHYIPPEMFQRKRAYDVYKSDVWSVGILFYALINKNFPFERSACEAVIRIIDYMNDQNCDILDSIHAFYKRQVYYEPFIRQSICRMLVFDPSERASMSEIHQCLKSHFLRFESSSCIPLSV